MERDTDIKKEKLLLDIDISREKKTKTNPKRKTTGLGLVLGFVLVMCSTWQKYHWHAFWSWPLLSSAYPLTLA